MTIVPNAAKTQNLIFDTIRAHAPFFSANATELEPDYSSLCTGTEFRLDVLTESTFITHAIPKTLGKIVSIAHSVGASLFHDMITGRSVTGIIDFLNQTPIVWFSKNQATVETAT